MLSTPLAIIAQLEESIANHERQLETLGSRISGLESNIVKAQAGLAELKSRLLAPVSTPTPVPSVSPSKSLWEIGFPLTEARSADEIISYLTRKHGGCVHDKGIVAIASKSVYPGESRYALQNIAELSSDTGLPSKDESGPWICWDFGAKTIRPTHYTIWSGLLKSRWLRVSWTVKPGQKLI